VLFANDSVLINDIRDGFDTKFKQWRHTLEYRGFRFNKSKTEYLKYGFSGVEGCGVAISKAEKFRYLGLIIKEKGDIIQDINLRIRVG